MTKTTSQRDGMTPGDRRELRALIKRRFQMLRAEVKSREQELVAEAEAGLARKYQAEDAMQQEIALAAEKAFNDYMLALEAQAEHFRALLPHWHIEVRGARSAGGILAHYAETRLQERRAVMAAIPARIQDALRRLDVQELDLLQRLTVGAIESQVGQEFLDAIPTVGELVSSARMAALESALETTPEDPR